MSDRDEFISYVSKWLKFLSYVEWDRLIRHDVNGNRVFKIFGWIDRDDQYKDFIVIKATEINMNVELIATSSKKYSEKAYKDLHNGLEGHSSCERVEKSFDIANSIKLNT